ncbi:MAG TPA: hypothetical protein VH120_07430 [Gemmataceae bacterium]|jgi:hypothetical protein|nr:hypothetical protein [Gemmataceae bacterium]
MSFDGHVENGQIILDTPADLPDGAKVRVDLVPTEGQGATQGKETFYDRYKHLIGKAENLPPDASVNLDHYLYGTPKQSP